ncbi:Putative nudix hydrolase 2 [Caenorhabditis elegans]|uniref:Putative nudix hydrolase 2 n=1 Tax=Caenorhabditis elegans TaxID=6239 RepID=NDX2_CAEEL|nr:Putative nudix hydrolase 2 [Caenorhabditis elegans]O61902.1 RecName: Full=Putative nudix hydrolase 2 [Caenorhabditis elegans]CCD74269.1 Putative nudix hydrolase 2 [Caenorhabditis elegans]|eukprot:NP_503726.1 Putative nudix hydrolase 2 [Caenorhabditis elegans]
MTSSATSPTNGVDKNKNEEMVATPANCPYQLFNQEVVWNGKWIQTRQVGFKTHTGQVGVWQSVHRNTKPVEASADGVSIIARVRKQGKLYIVLVKQYRIPCGKLCLELPAGLIDAGETAQQAAIRELKEETGYVSGKVVMESKLCFLDPGLTDDSQCLVVVDVDGDAPENQNPVQVLDSTESIEVLLVEQSALMAYVTNLDSSSIVVESTLLAYAMGIQFATI